MTNMEVRKDLHVMASMEARNDVHEEWIKAGA